MTMTKRTFVASVPSACLLMAGCSEESGPERQAPSGVYSENIGQPIQVGDGAQTMEHVIEDIYLVPRIGEETATGIFAVFTVSVSHIGSESSEIELENYSLLNPDDDSYQIDPVAQQEVWGGAETLAQINPGQTVTGRIVFDIPDSTSEIYRIKITPAGDLSLAESKEVRMAKLP